MIGVPGVGVVGAGPEPVPVLPPGVTGFGSAVIIGDLASVVNFLPKRCEKTRRRYCVATFSSMNGRRVSGTMTRICRAVASVFFTKMARAPSRLNTTVFLFLPRLKFLPRIVSVSPTLALSGVTAVTTG